MGGLKRESPVADDLWRATRTRAGGKHGEVLRKRSQDVEAESGVAPNFLTAEGCI